jgi:glycosyltransferase involved in cell wall biosynthesis
VVEGFAHGAPAIVRDLGALPETIEESGAGFTYTTNEELIEAMERLRTSTALRAELGANGRRAHEERWSEEVHLREYFDTIEEAAALRGKRQAPKK